MALTLYDMHTHTECSHDSRQPIDELCAAELAAGMTGVAVTDHSDTPYGHENGDFARLAQSIRNSRAAAQKYAGQLEVLCGVELGEDGALDNAKWLQLAAEDPVLREACAAPSPGPRS